MTTADAGGRNLAGTLVMALQPCRVLLVYFSMTGRVERVARDIARELGSRMELTVAPPKPAVERPLWTWLALSFLPGSSVRLASSPKVSPDIELVCLGLPKWSVSCPPVNRFLSGDWVRGHRFATFVCYGGFDEERYLRNLRSRLCRQGGEVVAEALFRRRDVDSGAHGPLAAVFCSDILSAMRKIRGERSAAPEVVG